jgi:hypothetical protein
MSAIGKVNAELAKLIEKNADNMGNIYFIKFDSQFEVWKIDMKDKKVQEFRKPLDLLKNPDNAKLKPPKITLRKLFTGDSGGTVFGTTITKIALSILKNNGNIILFTDDDITWDENSKNILLLMKKAKKPFSFNIILKDKYSFDQFVKKIKAYKYLTYFGF